VTAGRGRVETGDGESGVDLTELAKAQVAVDHARDALGIAETNHASVYAAATRAGRSDAELSRSG
jgi:hypothetical protein